MAKHTSWGCIGSVGVRVGQVLTTYASIEQAVSAHRTMLHEIFNTARRRPADCDRCMQYAGMAIGHPSRRVLLKVVFLDVLGLAVPVWRVYQAYVETGLLAQYSLWYPNKARRGYVHQVRSGPVIGIRNWGARHYRRDRTAQECRNISGLEVDEDVFEHPHLVRAKRARYALPCIWDEITRSRRGNGWKQHRSTQYYSQSN